MRFTLVRHGETIQNKDRIIQGHLPGELSERGKSQVRKTGRELASTDFTHIFSSDLNRCKQTTGILSKHHESTKVTYDERIRERFFGDWEGLAYEDGMWDSRKGNLLHQSAPGGETMDNHKSRAIEFINEKLGEFNENDNILVVSHGGTIRVVVAIYYSIPMPNLWCINTANAQVIILDIEKPLPNKLDIIK